jgi:glycosyltransferase involved in cell wall biosynthesis
MGGASIHVLDLASGMQSQGHDVTILVGGNGILFDIASAAGVKCVHVEHLKREISLVSDLRCFFYLRKILRESKPDLLHVHSSKAGFLGRFAAKSLNIPVVFTAHGWAMSGGVSTISKFFYKSLERLAAYLSSAIITVSNYDRDLALDCNIGNSNLITAVHNGVPDIPDVRQSKKYTKNNCKFLMVARFDDQKNHCDLLNALANIPRHNWELDLVGDGPLFSDIKRLAHKLDIHNKINFVGYTSNVKRFLLDADVFVLISNWEGLPLTILEAMSVRLPIVASNVGGVSECVTEHENGFLIEREDVSKLTLSLNKLIESKEFRKHMGNKSREKYEKFFTFDRMLGDTICVYNQTLVSGSARY